MTSTASAASSCRMPLDSSQMHLSRRALYLSLVSALPRLLFMHRGSSFLQSSFVPDNALFQQSTCDSRANEVRIGPLLSSSFLMQTGGDASLVFLGA